MKNYFWSWSYGWWRKTRDCDVDREKLYHKRRQNWRSELTSDQNRIVKNEVKIQVTASRISLRRKRQWQTLKKYQGTRLKKLKYIMGKSLGDRCLFRPAECKSLEPYHTRTLRKSAFHVKRNYLNCHCILNSFWKLRFDINAIKWSF
jgi:hypothetical protein